MTVASFAVVSGLAAGLLSHAIAAAICPKGLFFKSSCWALIALWLLWSMVVNSLTHRILIAVVSGWIYAEAIFLVWILSLVGSKNAVYLIDWWGNELILFVISLLVSTISALMAMTWHVLHRALWYCIEEQDGSLCWGCAYRLQGVTSARCPECGRPRSEPLIRWFALRCILSAGGRVAPWLSLLLCCAALSLFAIHYMRVVSPLHRFVGQFAEPSRSNFAFSEMKGFERSPLPQVWDPFYGLVPDHLGMYQRFPNRRDLGVIIHFDSSPADGNPAMQIELVYVKDTTFGTMTVPAVLEVRPLIHCNLGPAGAERIIELGVPPTLITALISKMEAAGCSATAAEAFAGGFGNAALEAPPIVISEHEVFDDLKSGD